MLKRKDILIVLASIVIVGSIVTTVLVMHFDRPIRPRPTMEDIGVTSSPSDITPMGPLTAPAPQTSPEKLAHYNELVNSATEVRLYDRYAFCSAGNLNPDRVKQLIISDKKAIQSLFGGMDLKAKPRCACAHSQFAVIVSPKGKCILSFCDHCFDVEGGADAATYRMPPGFHQAYYKAWQTPTSMPISRDDFFRETATTKP